MSISNSTTPQVRVRTPRGVGFLERIWRLGDRWMSTVDHVQTIQLYPLEDLRPVRTDRLSPQLSHVVRRTRRASAIMPRLVGIAILALTVAAVGFAWVAGLGV